jgi:16S rRNA (cytosine967-C5)-methyltransferase
MVSQSILNRAAQVLHSVTHALPADAALRSIFAAHRHWSPEERRLITRAVFSYYRWLQWLENGESLQSHVAQVLELQDRFEKMPSSVKHQALAVRAVPLWLKDEMELSPDFLRQLQREPALWLRAKAGCEAKVEQALDDAQRVDPCPPPLTASFPALRYNGTHDLFHTAAFQEGLFEIQDLGSQWVGQLCAPQPGEIWWDACAGQGGKTLHLADLMQGKGLLWASDRSQGRLERLKLRAARAQVFTYRSALWDGTENLPTKTPFDGVLLDAPCSGVGTWRRNPHARWTTLPSDVKELAEIQQRLLGNVAPSLKVGGKLVYAVCTLTRSETTAVVEAFTAAHPEFQLTWSGALYPQDFDCNGMFAATWMKNA